MAVDTRLADGEPARIDLVFDRHERRRDRLARAEMLKPAAIGGKTSVINLELLALRLTETIGALDMGEVAAVFRVHLTDDEIAFLHLPRGRHPERMGIGIPIAIPQE